MLNFGDNKQLEEGGENGLPPEQKESESSSSSDETGSSSSGSSSENEEEEEVEEVEVEEEEEDELDAKTENNDEPVAHNDARNGDSSDLNDEREQDGAAYSLCCKKCQSIQNRVYELVKPRRISKGRFLLSLEAEGTYGCAETGLVFEVTQRVQIKYRLLSWSKYGGFLKDSWRFAGPMFDVDCDPTILKSIQFPHSLCLADEDSDLKFSVLHVKNSLPQIEPSADHSGSHIKWNVTSLSPVGPVVKSQQPTQHHGVVIIYKEVGQETSYSFRVYLASNNDSDVKDIRKAVQHSVKKYVKLEKPPTCQRQLVERRKYRLTSEPEGDITPADFLFTLDVVKMKGYFELFFDQPPPFKLSLTEVESDQTVWSATIREGDCVISLEEKPKRRAEKRKRSTSTSEEEVPNKRAHWPDETDGTKVKTPLSSLADVTDQQLMRVAKLMGKEWKQVAILYLGLSHDELEKIAYSEEEPIMQRFYMLRKWRSRKGKGEERGLVQLHKCLDEDDVSNELRDCLEDMVRASGVK